MGLNMQLTTLNEKSVGFGGSKYEPVYSQEEMQQQQREDTLIIIKW